MCNVRPPKIFLRFFRWYCHPKMQDYIEGDLMEVYAREVEALGKTKADTRFAIDVLLLCRPGIIKPAEGYKVQNTYGMYKSYFKIGWRNLVRNRGYSFINIGGLALGMAVTLLIGLWVFDELSYDGYHHNRDRVAAVMQNQTFDGHAETSASQSFQLGDVLRNSYGDNFKHVVMSSFTASPILSYKENAITKTGYYMEVEGPELLSLDMIHGSRTGLTDQSSILLAESVARSLFGNSDPMGQVVTVDNEYELKVTGIYRDLPDNSSFSDLFFIAPLDLLINEGNRNLSWFNNWLMVLVELADNVDMNDASRAIKNAKLENVGPELARFNPEMLLHPMTDWYLYGDFENGVNTKAGRIEMVRLFGIIGAFVLLLACINFINLSTASSEKRAREVGIRKVAGSYRGQLIGQFFSESFLTVCLAFVISVVLVQMALPWFNEVSGKNMDVIWNNPWLWLSGIGIMLITALVAGSYPALYLSAFHPAKVLRGTLRVGSGSTLPRRFLVVLQFTVSIAMVVGTVVIYQQIEHVRNRPVGYDRSGLLTIPIKTEEVKRNFSVLRNDLLATGLVEEVAMSECEVTDMWWSDYGFQWESKDPDMQDNLYRGAVDFEFGKTVGWKIIQGRDFSRDMLSDSAAMILNEAMVEYMGFKDPIGQTVRGYGIDYTVIGVVEDMVSQSLFSPVKQTYYVIDRFDRFEFINVRIKAQAGASDALQALATIFKNHNPSTPFEYHFADEKFASKYAFESRVGTLAGSFAALAVVISCLGLFGLASYMAERRKKEMGIRKVVGASLFSLWTLLSRDFVFLVLISCLIALPAAWYFMHGWLQRYEYRTDIAWWMLVASGVGALVITIATVSFQSVRVAKANPVNSLRSE